MKPIRDLMMLAVCCGCSETVQPVEPQVDWAAIRQDLNEFSVGLRAMSILADATEQLAFIRGNGIVNAANDLVRIAKMRSRCLNIQASANRVSMDFGPYRMGARCSDAALLRSGHYDVAFMRNEPTGRLIDLTFEQLSDPRGSISGQAQLSEDEQWRTVTYDLTPLGDALSIKLKGEQKFLYDGDFELSGWFSWNDGKKQANFTSIVMERGAPLPKEGSMHIQSSGREIEIVFLSDGNLSMLQAQIEGETLVFEADEAGRWKEQKEDEKDAEI